MSAVVEALGRVRAKITEAEREANRPSGSARLVAVSKTFPDQPPFPLDLRKGVGNARCP